MSPKSKLEKANYKKAKEALLNTISILNRCDSYDELQSIISTIENEKKSAESPYTLDGLNEHHQSKIRKGKAIIDLLIYQKTKEFPNPVQPVEITAKDQETVPIIESSKQVESNPVEVTNKSSDQPKSSRNNDRDLVRVNELSNVKIQLVHLWDKMEELYEKSHQCAIKGEYHQAELHHNTASDVKLIFDEISSRCIYYAEKKIDLDTLKQQLTECLENNKEIVTELKTHPDCKDVIANFLSVLTGEGLVALAAESIYKGRLTMFIATNTDSGNKKDASTDSLEDVKSPSSPR
ncbi:hypothetical protein [Legionella bononiensis]|uniref:Coiled-coil protein n=1 Tax=Legionella bononiensis TaxID=2793102 RepID=A0ABS1WE31_9GAMM|nr:hypothetical protein [Legionella bononiensis]MBL7479511.1 hypothetical protein [Legionella bononiensis]MBL7527615.1 hypothetical protein [Legionella bononiensis]